MKKKENEFSKTLEELERKVEEINAVKKIQIEKEKKEMEQDLAKKREEKEKFLDEERIRKVHSRKTNFYILLSYGLLLGWILFTIMRRDQVDFWFHVIVAICYTGFYFMARSYR